MPVGVNGPVGPRAIFHVRTRQLTPQVFERGTVFALSPSHWGARFFACRIGRICNGGPVRHSADRTDSRARHSNGTGRNSALAN